MHCNMAQVYHRGVPGNIHLLDESAKAYWSNPARIADRATCAEVVPGDQPVTPDQKLLAKAA
jgi:hypothetical protein